ncbi:MAG: ferrochelatase [Steroidobacteraceae bacterium]
MTYYRAVVPSAAAPERIGVLLVNLGTPDSPSYFAVQRYLREFLADRRVIETSRLIWLPILYGIVLPFRPIKTVRKYRKIWMSGGSPLAVYSRRLTEKVGSSLHDAFGDRLRVALAMTYGNPDIADAIRSLAVQNVKKLLVLPLYPQYCSSTTGSVFDSTVRVLQRWRWLPETRFVNGYCDDAGYIEALTMRIQAHWFEAGERSHLVLSYHGIPASYVAQGDPYQTQAETTTRLLVARLGLGAGEYSHCYQSRFGSVVWLQPYTEDTLAALVGRGVRRVTVVSPSFAVDCLETLEEVAMEYRDKFLQFGGERLTLVPSLNDDDRHAQLLASIVKKQLCGWTAAADA